MVHAIACIFLQVDKAIVSPAFCGQRKFFHTIAHTRIGFQPEISFVQLIPDIARTVELNDNSTYLLCFLRIEVYAT